MKLNIKIIVLMFLAICLSCQAVQEKSSKEFLIGGDISALTKIEAYGGVFRDNGKAADCIEIFKRYGCNFHRLRIFVNPTGRGFVVQDVPYTIALAKRIKAAGAKLLLDFHYSDTWADPGKQYKPAAWEDLDFESLEKKVTEYTASVILEFKKEAVLPDIVQVGNEITPGFLWPDGKIQQQGDPNEHWDEFTRLLKAGITGVKEPLDSKDNVRIMIHIASGGDRKQTKWFFDNIMKHGVEFDIIGQSYYPWWHGTMDDLRKNLRETAKDYGKDILVVETAYPNKENIPRNRGTWSPDCMAWPANPQGQYDFLKDLIAAVKETPNGHGIGVIWWHPDSIRVGGLRIWFNGAMAMFDENSNALPVLKAFVEVKK